MTMGNAERVRALRERTGKTSDEVAVLVGCEPMEYSDLESYDDELSSVPSLAKIKRLAKVLGVDTPTLFLREGETPPARRVAHADLVATVRAIITSGTSQEELEDEVGWSLEDYLSAEDRALENYPVDFLKSLCARIGVPWIEALP